MSNEDLKEFVEMQFRYMNEKIDNNHRHSSEIQNNTLDQATKTNGRLGRLEVKVWEIEKEESTHIINCPNTGRIKALEDENMEVRVIKKYPRLAMGILIGSFCLVIGTGAYGVIELHKLIRGIKTEQAK